MRVLHVDTAREWRGGQTQLLHLVRRAPAPVALPPDAPLRPALEALGILTLPVDFRGPGAGRLALRRLARRVGADLIAAHTSRAHGKALGVGLPVVVHRRLDFRPRRRSRLKYAAPHGYVAVSGAVRDVLVASGVAPDRIAVVLDGVDPAPFDAASSDRSGLREVLGWPADAVVVLAVGALVPHKGHRWLVDAVARLPGIHLAVCGDGPLRAELEGRASGLGRRVAFLGQRDDVPRLLRSADLFAHPSEEEGMGQAVAEAMIAGVPVVASRAGGVPEVVGPHGHLVPPRDPAALAGAIAATLRRSDPARVEAARLWARDRHDPERMVAATGEAYARFLDRPPPALVDRSGTAARAEG